MTLTETIRFSCIDCGGEFPLGTQHLCERMTRRYGVKLLESLIEDAEHPTGLLALYRITYRLRSTLSGLDKYADRAALAQRVMRLDGCKTCMDVEVLNK
jgi:hypothetical protein